jgi:hypothetical protein
VRRLIKNTSGNYTRFDLAIAILIGIAIAAWLVSYALVLILYGHDRTARSGYGYAYAQFGRVGAIDFLAENTTPQSCA